MIECELRRLRCRDCGVHLEAVPWARHDAHHTRDFEDTVAWLAQQMAKTPIAGLLRIGWDTVGRIVQRVVADHLDERRLARAGRDRLRRDQLPPRAAVPDHGRRPPARGDRVVRPGSQRRDLAGVLRSARRSQALDPGGLDRHVRRLQQAIRENFPDAEICFDPFHVVRLAQRAVDQVRRDEWNAHERSHTPEGKWIKGTRWSLLKAPRSRRSSSSRCSARSSRPTSRSTAPSCSRKSSGCSTTSTTPRSRPRTSTRGRPGPRDPGSKPFVKLARTIRRHRDGILAAIRLGLNNGRLEGLNSRIRLISHRSFGFHSADPLIALIYLCCTGITIPLPR